ncbi:fimbrial protein [Pseudomonas protegens]|uniref:fimbrial protein n=1 Tax=Pseudomonas protegens TaxID=380021 RepID=UPI0009C0CBE5
MSTTAFNGVGGRSSPVVFSINLSCSGGDPGISIASYVTLTDTSNLNNISDILSLPHESSASGPGIQISKDGGIVKYGPDSTAIGTINQWKAGDIQTGASVFRIPLRASYIQTKPKVTTGAAIGRANFTLSYH